MPRPLTILLALLALPLVAKQYNFACDAVSYGTNYNVYVVYNGTTNVTTFTTNSFPNIDVPIGGQVYCTCTDTNGFESEPTITLVRVSFPPNNFRKK